MDPKQAVQKMLLKHSPANVKRLHQEAVRLNRQKHRQEYMKRRAASDQADFKK